MDFQTKEIPLDDISLSMRDIYKLKTRATIERAWTMSNSSYKACPRNLRGCTRPLIASYKSYMLSVKKAHLRAIVKDDCNKYCIVPEKVMFLELLQELRSCLMLH